MTALLYVILGAVLLTVVSRRLPVLSVLTERGVRPLACNACMSAWCALAMALLMMFDMTFSMADVRTVLIVAVPGGGGAYVVLELLELLIPRQGPPELPEALAIGRTLPSDDSRRPRGAE